MNFLRFLISWQFWVSIVLALIVVLVLWLATFKWLDEYAMHGISIEIPDLSQYDVYESIAVLEEKGLKYEIDSVRFDSTRAPNSVIEFFPVAFSNVKPGRTVFIKTNPQTSIPVALPNLIDKSKRLAFTQ